jgi:hypothetical protein
VLAEVTGYDLAQTRAILGRLAVYGLVRPWSQTLGGLWRAASPRVRSTVAKQLEVYGALAARARSVAVDREVWAWWQGEEGDRGKPRENTCSIDCGRSRCPELQAESCHQYLAGLGACARLDPQTIRITAEHDPHPPTPGAQNRS